MFDYEIKIASCPEELEKALRLRFEIFKLELGKGLNRDFDRQLDEDIYDRFCEHLIVTDKSKDQVVGTYRLLLASRVDKKLGFYSEKFFDITKIKRLRGEMLELGQSCVHRDYRNQFVINLLWIGIARYIKDHDVRYLFGSVRLATIDPQEVSETFRLIEDRYFSLPRFRVTPWPETSFKGLDEDIELKNPKQVLNKLPPLVKGYLRLGVKVCGRPALNPDFGSVVLFILLDIEKMTASYRRHYFGR